MKKTLLLSLFMALFTWTNAQETSFPARQIESKRTEDNIKIDGVFDEMAWQRVPVTNNFIQNQPNPGNASSQNTEVRILYDDKAFYVAAYLYDAQPDSILRQYSERDDVVITDWFGVILDAYQDGLNGVGFIVTAAGVQVDTKYSALTGNEEALDGDRNWDAVWSSKVKINGDGWAVEMKIPYSAIRFPQVEEQQWNINFARMIRRYRELSYFNEVKPEIGGMLNQSGKLTGIRNIKSPLRLQATPFIATYAENYFDKDGSPKSTWGRSINGGMDLKYGINDAFTLDLTLIPDFGQAQSDNQVLNLSPFEVRFDENRPFFTEGTELFNKGGLFYSRRVGGRPLRFFDIESEIDENTEEITSNPLVSQLINATKISGRTNKGLGVGLFNATSRPTFATVRNLETKAEREIETNPLTNYNVFVLDQNLKNNSYVTLINTNVMRDGATYDANVTGTQFELKNKANSYSLSGGGAVNQKYYSGAETFSASDSVDLGYKYNFRFQKTNGNFRFGSGMSVESQDYDPNDLGFLFNANEQNFFGRITYDIYKPFGIFNRAGFGSNINYNRLQKPNVYTNFGFNLRGFFVTKNFVAFGAWVYIEPVKTYNYFEPRTADYSRFLTNPSGLSNGAWISSDYRKKFAYDINLDYTIIGREGRRYISLNFQPRLRINDKLSFNLDLTNEILNNDVGFVFENEDSKGYNELKEQDITFGIRDQLIFDNVLSANYIFNNNMSLSFRARHYWTRLTYESFHELGLDGRLYETTYRGMDDEDNRLHDTNFNIFNIDMVYRWRFAPGSDLFFVWKNAISNSSSNTEQDYFYNLGNLFEAPQLNSFSLKVIYFLDYLDFKKS